MIRRFNPTSEHPARAVQAWQILVSVAKNRQTITYELLSEFMYGKKAQGVLNAVLGHIAFYCLDSDLPPLTLIVVGRRPGRPGQGFPAADPSKIDEDRERVHKFDSYDIYPPSEADLISAYENHKRTASAVR
jgi:hypothetical protein